LALRFPPDGVVDVIAEIAFGDRQDVWPLTAVERNCLVLHVRVDSVATHLVLIISGSGNLLRPTRVSFTRASAASRVYAFVRRLLLVAKRDRFAISRTLWQAAFRASLPGSTVIAGGSAAILGERPYDTWIRLFDEHPQRDRSRHLLRLNSLTRRPLFSVLATSQRTDPSEFCQLARSLSEQVYPHWQLLVGVPGAIANTVRKRLSLELPHQAVVQVIAYEGDDATTRNALVSHASGEFLVSLPTEMVLRPHTLLELALTLEACPKAAFIYSD
jgi:hypothetical protein